MINILGKIELPPSEPRREKKEILRNPEQILSAIDAGMMKSIPALNQRIASFKGAPEKLINESGQVDMDAYVVTHSRETVHFDKENAFQQKRGFYETYKEETQKKYGTTDEQKIIEKIISERRMKDGAVSEETLFLLMNKALGERYVAMRSSDHDDFLNGN
jgi:hypothetical protein